MTNTQTTREARRAAQLAKRAAWQPTALVTVTAADVVAGDFIERIRTANGVRGALVQSTVTTVETTHGEWGVRTSGRRGLFPVEGRRFHVAAADLVDLTVPATQPVVVRRAVTA